jgi:hypothetical protein
MKPIIFAGIALACLVSPALAANASSGLTCLVIHDEPPDPVAQTWDYEFLPDPSRIAQTMSREDQPGFPSPAISMSLKTTPSMYIITDDEASSIPDGSHSRTTIDRQTGHFNHIVTWGGSATPYRAHGECHPIAPKL